MVVDVLAKETLAVVMEDFDYIIFPRLEKIVLSRICIISTADVYSVEVAVDVDVLKGKRVRIVEVPESLVRFQNKEEVLNRC